MLKIITSVLTFVAALVILVRVTPRVIPFLRQLSGNSANQVQPEDSPNPTPGQAQPFNPGTSPNAGQTPGQGGNGQQPSPQPTSPTDTPSPATGTPENPRADDPAQSPQAAPANPPSPSPSPSPSPTPQNQTQDQKDRMW